MGIETLNSAARAAGFAMATTDEIEGKAEKKPETNTWCAADAALLPEPDDEAVKSAASVSDRVKGLVLSVLGRGAPA